LRSIRRERIFARLKIFLSYPSEARDVAERVNIALLALGHDVFFDRDDLAPGREYDQAIARSIAASDLFVFLITPQSVTAGRYTLTELGLAQRKWPAPGGRVLPVMLRPTEISTVPAYLRAVSFLVPSGEVVAETVHAVRSLLDGLPLTTRVGHGMRSRTAVAALVAIAVVGGGVWYGAARGLFGGAPREGGGARAITPLPDTDRQRARAVFPMADGGFAVAAGSPPALVRYAPNGDSVIASRPLWGEPLGVGRTRTQMLIATRAPDGVTVIDWKDFHVVDTIRLDPTKVKPPSDKGSREVKLSGEIRSAAVDARSRLWVVTGDREGSPALLRFRSEDRTWDLPNFMSMPDGIVGGAARDLQLRFVGTDLWALAVNRPRSDLYHLVAPMGRLDGYLGADLPLVGCAQDVASNAAGNLLLLSCDNQLQEIRPSQEKFGALDLVSSRPTLPNDSIAGARKSDIIVPDSAGALVALNTETPDSRPAHTRIVEVDSAGVAKTVMDTRNAIVTSMAVTPRWIVVVLKRADGSTDAMRIAR
jgi:hypothetical protein